MCQPAESLDLALGENKREKIKYYEEIGVGLIHWQPLRGGFLARPLTIDVATARAEWLNGVFSEADQGIVRRVKQLAVENSWTMSQVALQWASQKVLLM